MSYFKSLVRSTNLCFIWNTNLFREKMTSDSQRRFTKELCQLHICQCLLTLGSMLTWRSPTCFLLHASLILGDQDLDLSWITNFINVQVLSSELHKHTIHYTLNATLRLNRLDSFHKGSSTMPVGFIASSLNLALPRIDSG